MSNSNLSVSRNKSESTSSTATSNEVSTRDKADAADVTAFQCVMEKKNNDGKNKDSQKDTLQSKATLSDLFKKDTSQSKTTLSDLSKKDTLGIDNGTDVNLNGAFGAIAQQAGQSVSNINVSADAKEIFSKIGNEIVEKMIATNNALDAKQEVNISFKNDVLPGTEAILSKDGNRLSVSFVTNVEKSQQVILQNRNDLQSMLSEKINGANVVVSVVKNDNSTSSYTGDGRSRNQYYSDKQNDEDQKK